MPVEFQRVEITRDLDQLVEFLCNDEWPFHGQHLLAPDDIVSMDFSSPAVASFWIVARRQTVGLVRLLDLDDIGEGAPLFDLRIASRHRRCGFGMRAARWVVDLLFTSYPELHRIEANTRHDNAAMQRVLLRAGFTHEGRLRDAWRSSNGQWFDTMIFGMLRTDWTRVVRGGLSSGRAIRDAERLCALGGTGRRLECLRGESVVLDVAWLVVVFLLHLAVQQVEVDRGLGRTGLELHLDLVPQDVLLVQ